MVSRFAGVGMVYALAMTGPAKVAAIKAKKVTDKGFSIVVGIPGCEKPLDMTAAEYADFISTFQGKK
jgi:hypothetical protein